MGPPLAGELRNVLGLFHLFSLVSRARGPFFAFLSCAHVLICVAPPLRCIVLGNCRFLQGSYAGAEAMLRDTLTGAEEGNEQLVEVGYALGVLAGALKEQVCLEKICFTPHTTASTAVLPCDILQYPAGLVGA